MTEDENSYNSNNLINANQQVHIKNEEQEKETHFDTIGIYNKLYLKKWLDNKLDYDHFIYICGKMFSHTTLGKYSFEACDFWILDPSNDNNIKLYHSVMNSENCFTESLKWNPNFFQKIRGCLNSSNWNKNTFYFNITDREEYIQNESEKIIKKYLELHFIVNKKDIVSFRLALEEYVQNDPQIFFIDQVINLELNEQEILRNNQKNYYNKEQEIEKTKFDIENIQKNYENKKKEITVKFYLLNKEKTTKIKKLSEDFTNIKKHKKK
jgi:hypothetical protein